MQLASRRAGAALVLAAALGLTLAISPDASAGPAVPTAKPHDPAWQVTDLGHGRYQVSWTSPKVLPTTSDRPTITGDGLAFGTPTVGADGRTVSAVVTAPSAPSPADLDVVLSGDRLDEPGFDPDADGSSTKAPHRATTPLAAPDPGTPGSYDVTTSDYTWPSVKVPGMRKPIEMVGHVVEPVLDAPTGPRPLVLFLHGRHGVCYDPSDPDSFGGRGWPCKAPYAEIPSQLGYDYIQRLLASQGYTTVSVRVNGINAQDYRLDDGGADARATIVQAHLDGWVDLAAEHHVDMDQVVLVGHSRGGEGVDRASIQIPASAPYRIAGQVLIAPTDFAAHTAPYVPTVTLLPYCDGDVFDLQGQKFTDVARDLVPGDTSLKSSVMVMGANHNFFNTEWTPGISAAPSFDDWGGDPDATCGSDNPGRLSADGQQAVGKAYVAGAVHLFTGDDDYLPMFDGSPVTVPSIGDAQVLTHAIGGGRDTRRPGIEARPTIPSGDGDARLCNGVTSYSSGSFAYCGRHAGEYVTPDWSGQGDRVPTRKFLDFSWDATGATGGLRFDEPLDLSADRLELRTLVDPALGDPDLRVRISDSAGGSAVLEPVPGTEAKPLPLVDFGTKIWAEAVVVDASSATGVDLTDVTAVDLVAGSEHGHVWVADVSAAPSTLPAEQAARAPKVSIEPLRVDEGTGGTKVLRVPYTIAGAVTQPSKFVAFTAGQVRGQTQRLVVDVAPGQTGGTIPIEYVADDLDGPDQITSIALWPLRGVATDDYLASATVVDDDAAPAVHVEPVSPSVREGHPVEIRVRIDGARSDTTYVAAQVVRGRGEPLRGADVPAGWLTKHATGSESRKPLYRLNAYLSGRLRPGASELVLSVPTRKDGVQEGREYLDLRVQVGDRRPVTRRVSVLDAR
ncbi:hypothetical protein [Nocardioides panacisoli]|uniref:Secreted protein n=1 Tax=Nocardioides panacisoli TaxID=627624 RepID=A0ABP7IND2_9ACTN